MSKPSNLEYCLNTWLHNLDKYEAGKSFEEVIAEYGFEAEDILKLASNETTLGPSPKAVEAGKQAVEKSNYYYDPYSSEFVRFLEQHYQKQGLDIDQFGIVTGNGMDNVLDNLGKLFLDPKSSIIINSPTFVYYKLLAEWHGAEIIDIPRLTDKQFTIDVDKTLASIKPNTKIIFLCSPNNPTGCVIELEDIEQIAKQSRAIVFVDHAYLQFTDAKYDAIKLINKYPNIVIGHTFSKAYALAGLRIGYAIMHRDIKNAYQLVSAPFVNSGVSVAAAQAAIEDEEHLQKVISINEAGKKQYYEALESMGLSYEPTESNFLLIKHSKYTARELAAKLLKKAIIVRPMESVSQNTIRVTIGSEAENDRLIKALQELD